MYNDTRNALADWKLGMHRSMRPAFSALMLMAAGISPAFAQTAAPAANGNGNQNDGTVQMEAVVVEGYRESLANSLEAERAAKQIKSVISADAIGNLPDKNVAEALSRLAGISTTVSDGGEGRFVTIRGIEPGLNGITLNGETVATSDSDGRSGRAAPLDLLSSASAGSIEVYRTVTPDMDAESLGGTINILTPSAFDYDKSFRVFGSAEGSLNDLDAKKDAYSATLNYSQRFMDNKLGIFASVVKERINNAIQSAEIRRYAARANNQFFPEEIRLSQKDGYRDREGATVNLEYRPDNDRRFYLRLYTTDYDIFQDRPQFTGRIQSFVPESPTAGSARTRTGAYESRVELTARTTDQYVIGGEVPLGESLKLKASGTYSKAREDDPILTYLQLSAITQYNGAHYDITNPENPQITFPAEFFLPTNWRVTTVRPELSYVYHKTKTGKADLEWQGDLFGRKATAKVGVKYLNRQKEVRDVSIRYNYTGPQATFASDFGTGPLGMPTPAILDGRYPIGYRVNTQAFLDWFNKTRPPYPGQVDHGNADWVFLTTASQQNSIEDAYDLTEKVTAAYAMGDIQVNPQLSIFGGVRAERTQESLSAYLFSIGTTSTQGLITGEHSYTTVLPNLQFKYDINDKLLLRGAVSYTMGRPDFVDMAPISTLVYTDVDNNGQYEGSLEIGNPDLKPYFARNIDLYLTYYLPHASAISIGYFDKYIKNPIYETVKLESDITFQGRFYETFVRDSNFNAEPGKVHGVEITYQQNFAFLPAPFDGFGVVANYCWIRSSVSTFDRPDTVRFFRQPDSTLNLQLFYQNKRFDARIAYHWQDSSLEGIGETPMEDSYGDEREQLDFKGSVRLNKNWSIYGEARNLTNDTDRNFQADPRYITLIDKWGITYVAGVNWNY